MDSSKKPTPSKKDEIRKDVETELSVEELEERIAPATKKPQVTSPGGPRAPAFRPPGSRRSVFRRTSDPGRFHETSLEIHDIFTTGADITPRSCFSLQPHNLSEGTMDSSKDKARNELTPEQKAKVRPATEKDGRAFGGRAGGEDRPPDDLMSPGTMFSSPR